MSASKAFAAGWVSGVVAVLAAVAGLLAAYGRIIDDTPARNVDPAPRLARIPRPVPNIWGPDGETI